MVALNTKAYTCDWYCHLVGDSASFFLNKLECLSLSGLSSLI
jgi:hypothetical protein